MIEERKSAEYMYATYNPKKIKDGSKFKHVSVFRLHTGELIYSASMYKHKVRSYFYTEREAALLIDKVLIKHGEEPVNILKRK